MLNNKEEILQKISSMSLTEILELISDIEKKFSISSSDYQVNSFSKDVQKEDKKTEFDVYLKNIGNNKIAVIKIIRNFMNLGLKESKDLVESCPILIKEKINEKDLNILKKSLEEAGAVIEIK